MSRNGDDDYSGRNDDDENDGTRRTGMSFKFRRHLAGVWMLSMCLNETSVEFGSGVSDRTTPFADRNAAAPTNKVTVR